MSQMKYSNEKLQSLMSREDPESKRKSRICLADADFFLVWTDRWSACPKSCGGAQRPRAIEETVVSIKKMYRRVISREI